jgi:hypothetical protein
VIGYPLLAIRRQIALAIGDRQSAIDGVFVMADSFRRYKYFRRNEID